MVDQGRARNRGPKTGDMLPLSFEILKQAVSFRLKLVNSICKCTKNLVAVQIQLLFKIYIDQREMPQINVWRVNCTYSIPQVRLM